MRIINGIYVTVDMIRTNGVGKLTCSTPSRFARLPFPTFGVSGVLNDFKRRTFDTRDTHLGSYVYLHSHVNSVEKLVT